MFRRLYLRLYFSRSLHLTVRTYAQRDHVPWFTGLVSPGCWAARQTPESPRQKAHPCYAAGSRLVVPDASPHSPGTSVSITALAHGQSLSNLQLTAKFPQPRPGGAFYMRICIHELLSIRSSLRYKYALKLETSRRRRRSSISCNESPSLCTYTLLLFLIE